MVFIFVLRPPNNISSVHQNLSFYTSHEPSSQPKRLHSVLSCPVLSIYVDLTVDISILSSPHQLYPQSRSELQAKRLYCLGLSHCKRITILSRVVSSFVIQKDSKQGILLLRPVSSSRDCCFLVDLWLQARPSLNVFFCKIYMSGGTLT